jgi:hypothetical protein
MKNFLVVLFLVSFVSINVFAQAQAPKKADVKAKKETVKPAEKKVEKKEAVKPAEKKGEKKEAAKVEPGAKLKKDGTPDMRFKENKEKAKPAGPTKKDGTADMRYKSNKEAAKKK